MHKKIEVYKGWLEASLYVKNRVLKFSAACGSQLAVVSACSPDFSEILL